ncbi:methyltransferase domain-containing protein [Gracilibacillus salitolerans]|uniref:Methyltransferase domain-containing protein n=1 Tax=Gracilibacillus salitolerans TaxID=2663022 RepID=A0A5Q2TQA3_9BACI|nr:class I SAM-dependent methyltransferase [Gracilibacillus salitolerans]QGH35900.1 methyltransferase domain-containing protein [Gracilibacillus salitolerans]
MDKKEYGPEGMAHFAKKVEFLDNPERRGDIPPEQLLRMFPIKKEDNILDIGAGTGYITIPAAKIVDGLVYALDIDSKMLDFVNSKANKENITNVKTLKASMDDIPLNDTSIDIVLASIVLHEVKDLSTSLNQMKRVLKSGGYFVCVEFEKKESQLENHPRIPSSLMEQAIKNAGLSIIQKVHPTDFLYIIIAKK